MKRIVGFFLIVAGLVSCDSGKIKFTVETDIEPQVDGKVLLVEYQEQGLKPIDTLELVEPGRYECLTSVEKESFYRIVFFQKDFVNLVLDGSERKVYISLIDNVKKVEGSVKSDFVNQIDQLLAKTKSDVDQMNQEAILANQQGDAGTVQAIVDEYNAFVVSQVGRIKGIVRQAGPSLAAIYGLNYLDKEADFAFYDSVVAVTYTELPDHFWVRQLKEYTDSERALAIGQLAPDFTLDSPLGEAISLNDFKGKYVLIDFWAAWCRPCRMENPNVVRIYQKYGGDQFDILGVSLDRTREAWTQAILDDGLTWKHVSDLSYFDSKAAVLYNIKAIPATYLIDPQGRIIAKNLRGASLEAKLKEIFGE